MGSKKNTFLYLGLAPFFLFSQNKEFELLYSAFNKEYSNLPIPATDLDYSVNFSNIQPDSLLQQQQIFFKTHAGKLSGIDMTHLDKENKTRWKQMSYEINENLERIALEKKWNASQKVIPVEGLHTLENYKDWYAYYVKHFTGVNVSPDEVYKTGQAEVEKAQNEIKRIESELGYRSEDAFYKDLKSERFFIRSKPEIISGFAKIDSTVRKNLPAVFNPMEIPVVEAMEWPGASASTPPGIYLGKANNPYKVDVFQFNFSTGKYNKRCMDWLYIHEAIPGHHLQSTVRQKGNGNFYFGTTEGWACYVEDLGKDVGLYTDPYSLLGKCEWNLVRSARLVMEVGIHYYGWSFDDAMLYWKKNIKGQDEIAEREIRRITNWAGQSLCYKIGALAIKQIVSQKMKEGLSLKDAHQFILEHSDFPLMALL
jgi:uncharacterized protein (DUF885 family)